MAKKRRNNTMIAVVIVAAAILVGFYLFSQNIQLSTIQNYFWESTTSTTDGDQSNSQGIQPTENFRIPTSLTVQVSPNPTVMGRLVYGTVTSNGYNYPITVYARNLGAEEWTNHGTQTFDALLGGDGKYEHLQQVNVPGYWEFWATSGSVTSNTASLTVQGILVTSDQQVVTDGDSYVNFVVFSNFKNAEVSLFANDPSRSISIPLQTVNTDGTGSVGVAYNFNDRGVFPVGNYEIDAIIAGQKASSYGGSLWLQVN